MLVLLYLIATILIGKCIPATILFYYLILANSGLAVISLAEAKKRGLTIAKRFSRLKTFRTPAQLAAYIAIFQIVLSLSLGFLVGFGKSPYSFKLQTLIVNMLFVSSSIVGIEFSRSYLTKALGRKIRGREGTILIVSTIYFAVTLYPSLPAIPQEPLEFLRFFGQKIVPTFSQQLFATLLVQLGGAYASIVYFAIIRGFEWFSPLLPNLDWSLGGFINTIPPILGYFIIEKDLAVKRVKIAKESLTSWTATAAISMLVLLFFTGAFGYHPAIVGSGSMRPSIDVGDVVVVQHCNAEDLRVGDVIQYYSNEGYTITHRIIEIKEEGKVFITKGDANEMADAPITADRVVGKVVFVIPKLGYLPLAIRKVIKYYSRW